MIYCIETDCYGSLYIAYAKESEEEIVYFNDKKYVLECTCYVEGGYYDEVMECFYTQLSCGHEVDKHERDFDYCCYCGAKVVEE